jgi:hypothetical protein
MRKPRTKRVLAAAAGGLLIATIAGAVASATAPGDGNVLTACMLKNVGTIRLIDPSLASSNLMSHCTSLETQVSWNQKGVQGPPGAFAGTLTSPNGAYSISVTDAGIVLRAPGASARLVGNDIMLDSSSATTVQTGSSFGLATGADLSIASGGNTTLQTAKNLVASTGADTSLAVGKDLTATVAGSTSFRGAKNLDVAVDGRTDVHAGGNVVIDSEDVAALRGAAGVLLSSPGPVTVNGTPIP